MEHDQMAAFNNYGASLIQTLQLPERIAKHRKRSDSSMKASKRTPKLHQATKCGWWSIMTPPYLEWPSAFVLKLYIYPETRGNQG